MITWNRSHRGAWQLFGHVHGTLDNNPVLSANQIDVGVDSHNFEPISYQSVKEIITQNNLEKIKGK
jgi:calcineurin-like phosphoesterase family protein